MNVHPYRMTLRTIDDSTLELVRPPRATKVLARLVKAILAVVIAALAVVPWQQNTRGKGRVIAYAPVERQQAVEAPIEGRVARWHVQEGEHVNEGDLIVDLSDNDPEILVRLRTERDSQLSRIEAARARLSAVEARLESLGGSREAAISAAASRVKMAEERREAAERALEASEQAEETARLNIERQRALFTSGLSSKRTVELAELDMVRARTEADRARASLRAARNEVAAVSSDRDKVSRDTQASLDDASATRASASAEIASATAELARIDVRLARQSTQAVRAPRAGSILRVIARHGAEMVKAGDPLAIIVPDTNERAVELWIDGNDIPLVTPGRDVRLQFEGWPAVQFAGWPQVSVGTFGGRVAFVDAADDGTGRFRAVIVPNGREPWPATRFLRQGTRVNGWVLLDRVRLGYELWRQFNGFPPQLPTGEMFQESGDRGVKK